MEYNLCQKYSLCYTATATTTATATATAIATATATAIATATATAIATATATATATARAIATATATAIATATARAIYRYSYCYNATVHINGPHLLKRAHTNGYVFAAQFADGLYRQRVG